MPKSIGAVIIADPSDSATTNRRRVVAPHPRLGRAPAPPVPDGDGPVLPRARGGPVACGRPERAPRGGGVRDRGGRGPRGGARAAAPSRSSRRRSRRRRATSRRAPLHLRGWRALDDHVRRATQSGVPLAHAEDPRDAPSARARRGRRGAEFLHHQHALGRAAALAERGGELAEGRAQGSRVFTFREPGGVHGRAPGDASRRAGRYAGRGEKRNRVGRRVDEKRRRPPRRRRGVARAAPRWAPWRSLASALGTSGDFEKVATLVPVIVERCLRAAAEYSEPSLFEKTDAATSGLPRRRRRAPRARRGGRRRRGRGVRPRPASTPARGGDGAGGGDHRARGTAWDHERYGPRAFPRRGAGRRALPPPSRRWRRWRPPTPERWTSPSRRRRRRRRRRARPRRTRRAPSCRRCSCRPSAPPRGARTGFTATRTTRTTRTTESGDARRRGGGVRAARCGSARFGSPVGDFCHT